MWEPTLESDVSLLSGRQNTKLNQAGFKEKRLSCFSTWGLGEQVLCTASGSFFGKVRRRVSQSCKGKHSESEWGTTKKVSFTLSLHFSTCQCGISIHICILGSQILLLTDNLKGHVMPARGIDREAKCPGGPEVAGALGKALLRCCGGAPGEGTALGLLALPLHPLPAGGCPWCAELDQNPWAAVISHRTVGGMCWGAWGRGTQCPLHGPCQKCRKVLIASRQLCGFTPKPWAKRVEVAFSGSDQPTTWKAKAHLWKRLRVRYSPLAAPIVGSVCSSLGPGCALRYLDVHKSLQCELICCHFHFWGKKGHKKGSLNVQYSYSMASNTTGML